MPGRPAERAVPVARQNVNSLPGGREVEDAVAGEVAHRHCTGVKAGGEVGRGPESGGVAEQHIDGAIVRVERREVMFAVAVEVRHGCGGVIPVAEQGSVRCRERAGAGAQQHVGTAVRSR